MGVQSDTSETEVHVPDRMTISGECALTRNASYPYRTAKVSIQESLLERVPSQPALIIIIIISC